MRKARHRSKLQIIADMLFAAGKGSRKTHIMYGANLSYELTNRYLTDLLDAGLIELSDDAYVVTEKGKEFLKGFRDYTEHQKEVSGQVEEVNNKKMKLEKMCSNSS